MKINIKIVIIIIIIVIYLYFNFFKNDMIYVKSTIDNKYYLVNKNTTSQQASNMLAQININMHLITNYLYDNKENYKSNIEYINRLHDKIVDVVVLENRMDNSYTSYSVNKGEQLIFCLRSKNKNYDLHDINLLMYVVLHEMAHIGCPIYDNHGELFKKIFAFLTETAISLNLYKKINFNKYSAEYCGMKINNSII